MCPFERRRRRSLRWEAGRRGAEIATEGRWMGVRVIQRGAAVTGAHLEGRGSQGHGGRRRGRLPWLAGALINAAERAFLPASNFSLSKGTCRLSQQQETSEESSRQISRWFTVFILPRVSKSKKRKQRKETIPLVCVKESRAGSQ